ncbi:MAG: SDR family oxidoreductase [Candidatus Thorarchaeota archaeon]|nr:SDR family oxidoreductase [Candidatus Thorarchaeota archaeon]
MDLQLKDKTILITGASKGLGYSVARILVQEGAHVIICSRSEEALKKATNTLGDKSRYIIADLTKSEDIHNLLRQVKEITPKLDGLFVNAGGPPPGRFIDITDDDWKSAIELVLMSTVRLTRNALPLLRKSESPSILYNTSSSVKQPTENYLLANSLRLAVIGMMRTLADELGPEGIRVNAVCPGAIQTRGVLDLSAISKSANSTAKIDTKPVKAHGRAGNPDEFGKPCAFLLSPAASYIHGTMLLVDGGLYRGMM